MKHHLLALALCATFAGNAASITPGGMAGWNYTLDATNITGLTFPFTVNTAPETPGYYYASQFGFTGATAIGYIGLQPRTADQYSVVFSSFVYGTEVVDSERCRLGADGSYGASCSRLYPIKKGQRYLFEVRRGSDDVNVWYGFVKEEGSTTETQIGAWRLPAGSGLLRSVQSGWIEYYKSVDTCYTPEVSQITVSPPYVTATGKQGSFYYPHEYGRCTGKVNYQYGWVGNDLRTTVGRRMITTDAYSSALFDGELSPDSFITIGVYDSQNKELEKHTVKVGKDYVSKWTWPAYSAAIFNSNLKKVKLGMLDINTGEINVKPGSSFENQIYKNKLDNLKVITTIEDMWVNNDPFGDELYTGDLASGSSVMITVKDQAGQMLEDYTVMVPDSMTGRWRWSEYTGYEFNNALKKIKIGVKDANNDITIMPWTSWQNKIWKKSQEHLTVKAEIFTASENPWVNHDLFGDKLAADLPSGSKVTIKVKSSLGNLLEEHTVELPDGHLDRYKWPPFAANEFNQIFKQIVIGEKEGDNTINVIAGSQYRNLIWKKERANLTVEVSID
ncbi:hypothetical protein [Pantoea phytobeneficialis]|uniref:N-acetylglucosamine binding protein A domain-containing protein n=2 Tax=Pantoea phytobeneficialis TaxID=2052056 RepID=A0ABT8Y2S1_9GAMM|nr:hypothetical protein [Pantoea phytobeneficialis]MDO6410024.1 hypothetical protein [Pantoea phytobeneficialis]